MSIITSRRALLQMTGSALLAVTSPVMAQTPIRRFGNAKFTPTLNAYSFLELLNANRIDSTKGIDLFGVCDFCAQHDIEAVDLTGYFFPDYPKPPDDTFVSRLKKYVHDRGIVISGTGVKNDFATADKTVRAEGVQLTKDWIEGLVRLSFASLLGRLRRKIGSKPQAVPDVRMLKNGWRTISALAQSMAKSLVCSWPCRTTVISLVRAQNTLAFSNGWITLFVVHSSTLVNILPPTRMPTSP